MHKSAAAAPVDPIGRCTPRLTVSRHSVGSQHSPGLIKLKPVLNRCASRRERHWSSMQFRCCRNRFRSKTESPLSKELKRERDTGASPRGRQRRAERHHGETSAKAPQHSNAWTRSRPRSRTHPGDGSGALDGPERVFVGLRHGSCDKLRQRVLAFGTRVC